MNTLVEPSSETRAFLDACRAAGPRAVSACPGWTAHDVAAHQAATAAEVVRHLEPHLAGEPVPATQAFAVREAPFRALAFDDLLERLVAEDDAARGLVARVLARDPGATVPWTGRRMVVATFPTHLRSECALHRWDLVGDDETSRDLLSAPELTDHAVDVLGRILPAAGAARTEASRSGGGEFRTALRSPGADDVVVEVRDREALLRHPQPGESTRPGLTLDAAARLLLLWGRRPAPATRIVSALDGAGLVRLQGLLAGY